MFFLMWNDILSKLPGVPSLWERLNRSSLLERPDFGSTALLVNSARRQKSVVFGELI